MRMHVLLASIFHDLVSFTTVSTSSTNVTQLIIIYNRPNANAVTPYKGIISENPAWVYGNTGSVETLSFQA